MREVVFLGVAVAIFGASYGAFAVSVGSPVGIVCLASVVVFAGSSQIAAASVFATGGSAVSAALSGILLNARYLAFGAVLGDRMPGGRWSRPVAAHLLIDETAAALASGEDAEHARRRYWQLGVGLFVAWNVGTVVGALAGDGLGDLSRYGLDAAFPAALLALFAPRLDEHRARVAAGCGALAALAVAAVASTSLAVLAAGVGAIVGALAGEREPAPSEVTP